MNGKKIIGNGGKATLPGGKKMDDFKKPPQAGNKNSLPNSLGGNKDVNNGEEKQKSKTDQIAQGVGSEALKKGLKTAFPYIPQFIINKLVDSNLGQKVIEKTLNKTKRKMIFMAISVAATLVLYLAIIAGFFALILGPIAWLLDVLGGVANFFRSIGHFIEGKGWCPTEAECQNKAENDYYETLKEKVKKYNEKFSCEINEDLITATIFYGQMVDSKKDESEEDEDGNNKYYDYLDVKPDKIGYQHAADQINTLLTAYFKGNADDKEYSDEDMESVDSCAFRPTAYKSYLINSYIPGAYGSILDRENISVEKAAEEILEMGNIMLINRAFASSIYCKSVAVEQSDGSIEPMSLEDYVAGVVTAENNWYEGDNLENMKAQAVAARTYVLYQTNNCQGSIKNSPSKQVVAKVPSSQALQAAEETNSMVLVKDGKVFSTMYDALAIASSDDKNYYLKQANLAIDKKWLDSKVTQSQYEWYAKNSHGQGLSQWGSRYLQHIGKNYEEILNTFYTPAELVKMGGLISGGNYSSNIGPAVDINELAERRDSYAGSLNIYSASASNVSQCPWYAKSRAIEIVYGSNMDEKLKQTAIDSLNATSGNGKDWYDNPDGTIFTKSTDYTQPQPGSIVTWEAHGSDSSCQYGHVAIVEQVLDNGNVLISESWNNGGANSGNSWNKTFYRVQEQTLDYVKSHKGSKCTMTFKGYVYLLN